MFLGNCYSRKWEVYRPKLILDKDIINNFIDENEISKNTFNRNEEQNGKLLRMILVKK